MLGVLIASWIPVLVGHWALRHRADGPAESHDHHVRRDVIRETATSSLALLAFLALSNLDVVVARSVLDGHDAGLYAGGLIVTKAVLFLPQFAVVILFPAMAAHGEGKEAMIKGLAFLAGLGTVCVAATALLSSVALIFIGGNDYAGVQDQLWLFAVLGGLLSVLQFLVYAGLATRSRTTKYLITAGVVVLVGAGATADGVGALAITVACVDAFVVTLLIALQIFRHQRAATTA